MLGKSGPLPEGPEWRFELKLDGFRAMVSTTGGLRVRSRRGWDMTSLVPELANLPPRLTLDGELIAFGEDKLPSFPRLCERMLHRRVGIPVAYLIFDLLEWRGTPTLDWPYRQRRELLDELELRGSHWGTGMSFEDGERLFRTVHDLGFEGAERSKFRSTYGARRIHRALRHRGIPRLAQAG